MFSKSNYFRVALIVIVALGIGVVSAMNIRSTLSETAKSSDNSRTETGAAMVSLTTVDVIIGQGGARTFSPATLNIAAGTTVHWIWSTGFHSTTSGNGAPDGNWDSGNLTPPSTFDHTFNTAGTFPYYCVVHGVMMSGTINVSPSAAGATVSGRVTDQAGRGISKAAVTMTDNSGNILRTSTGSFGYFSIGDVPSGQTYVISVSSKRYHFASRVESVSSDLADVDFVAEP